MSTTDSPPAAPKPSRRRYQYSLRTLLLLPTVLALVLSAIYSWPYAERRYILWRLQDYLDMERDSIISRINTSSCCAAKNWAANVKWTSGLAWRTKKNRRRIGQTGRNYWSRLNRCSSCEDWPPSGTTAIIVHFSPIS